MKIATTILAALMLAGCQSDEMRLEKLRQAETLERLREFSALRELDACGGCPARDSLFQNWRDATNRRDLAERATRRFLR